MIPLVRPAQRKPNTKNRIITARSTQLQRRGGGFTLLELLLVVALTIMLAAAALPLYSNLQWTTQLGEIEARALGEIRLARELSSARYNDSQYGLYFEVNPGGADRMIFFRGRSYATRDQSSDLVTSL